MRVVHGRVPTLRAEPQPPVKHTGVCIDHLQNNGVLLAAGGFTAAPLRGDRHGL